MGQRIETAAVALGADRGGVQPARAWSGDRHMSVDGWIKGFTRARVERGPLGENA